MAIPDKIGAANKINELLSGIVKHGGLRLKYRITVDPPMAEERGTSLLPCHHGSGALCILRCGIIPICARKAKATDCDAMLWCTPKIFLALPSPPEKPSLYPRGRLGWVKRNTAY